MRILIVTETYPPNINGAALATERLANGLADNGNSVSVVAPSTSFSYYKRKQGKLTIYRLRSILIQKTQDFRVSPQPFHAKKFAEIVDEVKPEIMHINNPGFIAQTAISVARERNIPVVGTSHFMPENLTHYLHLPDQLEKLINTSIWKIYARFYGRLNLIISPTQTSADILTRLKVGTKVKVISNGIDLSKFKIENKGDYLKDRYRIPNKLTLLFVGRIDKEKNIDVLLKAAGLIKDKADFHIVIVGKGKEEEPLKKLAYDLGLSERVTFTGYLPKADLHNIYKVGDIFVMPSIAELQSLVTMEGMACGLPVIGANAVALPHLIHDNENGFLFPPGDEKALAERLLKLLTDKTLREKMGGQSLRIIKEHDIKHVIGIVEETYRGVIAEYKPVPSVLNKVPQKAKVVLKKLKNIKKIIPREL